MDRYYWLVLGILAVWRITHLLNAEDGPAAILARFRARAGSGVLGELLDCFYCLSVWVSIPVAFVTGREWSQRLLLWPAISGGAILLERITSDRHAQLVAPYLEDKENDHALLQQTERTVPHRGGDDSGERNK
jgi:hypothetical protein